MYLLYRISVLPELKMDAQNLSLMLSPNLFPVKLTNTLISSFTEKKHAVNKSLIVEVICENFPELFNEPTLAAPKSETKKANTPAILINSSDPQALNQSAPPQQQPQPTPSAPQDQPTSLQLQQQQDSTTQDQPQPTASNTQTQQDQPTSVQLQQQQDSTTQDQPQPTQQQLSPVEQNQ